MIKTDSQRERWPVSFSVALRLQYDAPPFRSSSGPGPEHFILVSKRRTGLVGLIAGGLERGETEWQALWREVRDETNFSPESVRISPLPPTLRPIPHNTYTSVGAIFNGSFIGDLPPEGSAVVSEEISRVTPYSFADLAELVVQHPERLYKPEYNLTLIRDWLSEYVETKYGPFEGQTLVRAVLQSFGL